jgi:hypothetical protein
VECGLQRWCGIDWLIILPGKQIATVSQTKIAPLAAGLRRRKNEKDYGFTSNESDRRY